MRRLFFQKPQDAYTEAHNVQILVRGYFMHPCRQMHMCMGQGYCMYAIDLVRLGHRNGPSYRGLASSIQNCCPVLCGCPGCQLQRQREETTRWARP